MLFGDEHVRRYEETGGEVGHDWQDGVPTLVLTTKGRKTGEDRKFALIYQEIDGNHVIVASKGGADQHPGWYHNLVANPEVTVEVLGEGFPATARLAEGEEYDRLFHAMGERMPSFFDYQRKTSRKLPVIVLHRSA
jgi:proline iminopeptidase